MAGITTATMAAITATITDEKRSDYGTERLEVSSDGQEAVRTMFRPVMAEQAAANGRR